MFSLLHRGIINGDFRRGAGFSFGFAQAKSNLIMGDNFYYSGQHVWETTYSETFKEVSRVWEAWASHATTQVCLLHCPIWQGFILRATHKFFEFFRLLVHPLKILHSTDIDISTTSTARDSNLEPKPLLVSPPQLETWA